MRKRERASCMSRVSGEANYDCRHSNSHTQAKQNNNLELSTPSFYTSQTFSIYQDNKINLAPFRESRSFNCGCPMYAAHWQTYTTPLTNRKSGATSRANQPTTREQMQQFGHNGLLPLNNISPLNMENEREGEMGLLRRAPPSPIVLMYFFVFFFFLFGLINRQLYVSVCETVNTFIWIGQEAPIS